MVHTGSTNSNVLQCAEISNTSTHKKYSQVHATTMKSMGQYTPNIWSICAWRSLEPSHCTALQPVAYHAEGIDGAPGGWGALINTKQYHINIEQNDSNHYQHIQVGAGQLHNPKGSGEIVRHGCLLHQVYSLVTIITDKQHVICCLQTVIVKHSFVQALLLTVKCILLAICRNDRQLQTLEASSNQSDFEKHVLCSLP